MSVEPAVRAWRIGVKIEPIEEKTLQLLEWRRLTHFLSYEAETESGRRRCQELLPWFDRAVSSVLMEEVKEAHSLIAARSLASMSGLPVLDETLDRLFRGASLSARELLDIKITLNLTEKLKGQIGLVPAESFMHFSRLGKELTPHPSSSQAIEAAVADDESIKDEASTQLRNLRAEVRRLNQAIKDELLRLIHSSTTSKCLQEPIYTQRSGRYVLPVTASMRQNVQGIVHDSSASGLTVYVEPLSVVELSNKLRMRESEIEYEIARILAALTELCRAHHAQIKQSFLTLVEIDVILSKARLAGKYKGSIPNLSTQGDIVLKQARHPLLILKNGFDAIVANDIQLGDEKRTLIVTGPNTGGKTVVLKTVGLITLMAKCGIPVPAEKSSTVRLFDSVIADIGDEQSLEQNLSTFSSHLGNIVEIIRCARENTLVLLDEIGAGTDPKEGAALARSILEHLNDSGAVTLSTTHYGELKSLGYTCEGFLNGSLEFDESNLSPTFHLRLGIPGSSQALAIARRLGLSSSIVERSKELMSGAQEELQTLIENLNAKLVEAENQAISSRKAHEEAEAIKSQLAEREKATDNDMQKLAEKHKEKLDEELKLSLDYIKHTIADLQKQPGIAKAQKAQADLAKLAKELSWHKVIESPTKTVPSPGQKVKVLSLNQTAVVEGVDGLGREPRVNVRAGNLKVQVPLSDLAIIGQEAAYKDKKKAVSRGEDKSRRYPEPANVFVRSQANTVDLRGMRVEEALITLSKFVDDCLLHAVSPAMIIHGHGTGRVRQAVRDFVAQSNSIVHFRPGEQYEGGDGVTIIEV